MANYRNPRFSRLNQQIAFTHAGISDMNYIQSIRNRTVPLQGKTAKNVELYTLRSGDPKQESPALGRGQWGWNVDGLSV
jgi:hypothetical protein